MQMVILRELLEGETVGGLPIREAITVNSGTVVRAAVARMRSMEIGCVLIVNTHGFPVGIFTERSLLDVLVQNASLDESAVGDFADDRCTVVKTSDPVSRVWDAVEREGQRFICVTDEAGKVVGLTGQRGLAEYISEYFPGEVMVQRIGGKPWMEQREGA